MIDIHDLARTLRILIALYWTWYGVKGLYRIYKNRERGDK